MQRALPLGQLDPTDAAQRPAGAGARSIGLHDHSPDTVTAK